MHSESLAVLGVVILLVLSAIATALIIYTNMSTPREYQDYDAHEKQERAFLATKEGRLFESMMSIYWLVITVVYLAFSFVSGAWHLTWIIWPLAGILSAIIKTIVEMRQIENE